MDFQIVGGEYEGRKLKWNGATLKVAPKSWGGQAREIKFDDITEIEEIDENTVNATDSVTFGAVGALVGGPLGAAIGAGIGRVSRNCVFAIRLDDGTTIVAKGWKLHFDTIHKPFKIHCASMKGASGKS